MEVDLKLTVSPKKPRRSKNVENKVVENVAENGRCIVHNVKFDKDSRLSEFTEVSWKKVKEANRIRKSEDVTKLISECGSNEIPSKSYGYHRKCYSNFTHKKSLTSIKRKLSDEKVPEVKRVTGRKRDRHDYECCICRSKKTAKGGSGYERLEKCVTEVGAVALQEAAIIRNDKPQLLADVAGVDWKVINAREVHCHRTCYRKYTKIKPVEVEKGQENERVLSELTEYIEQRVFQDNTTVSIPHLYQLYLDLLKESDESSTTKPCDGRTLRSKILSYFDERIGTWCPKSGGYFIYNKNVETGEIIEVGMRIKAKSQTVEESLTQKVKDVAKSIRKEIKEAENTFSIWPPNEDQLLNAETVLPQLLKTFLNVLLTKREKRSPRKQKKIQSLGQDILYTIKNGKDRTIKHVLLALCTKVQLVNEDGNVRSTSASSDTPEHRNRARAFEGMQTIIQPVFAKKRQNPAKIHAELKPLGDLEKKSRQIDILWVLLRHQAAVRDLPYSIPNWTGFNALISERSNLWHRVVYLPAINQYPTKLETVQELLVQSKEKAESLGLSETDVVMNQAIYAKALEILLMPRNSELKNSSS
eukprot:gene11579-12772_t